MTELAKITTGYRFGKRLTVLLGLLGVPAKWLVTFKVDYTTEGAPAALVEAVRLSIANEAKLAERRRGRALKK